MARESPKILVIRRDNIGDLVCTTPALAALRRQYPSALICALVNSYNADVLAGHPALDRVYVYTKLKHRAPGQSRLMLLWQRLRTYRELRKLGFDHVLLPSGQPRLLRLALSLKPRHIVAFGNPPAPAANITLIPDCLPGEHEVQATYRLLQPLGIHDEPPPPHISANASDRDKTHMALHRLPSRGPVVAIHISARKPSQRWPIERFAAFMHTLHAQQPIRFLLLWAPGTETDPRHPGDDEKAKALGNACRDLPIVSFPTHTLSALMGALSACDLVVCSDGGAMHLAAALGKPILCFFGHSDAARWRPWGVPHIVLQEESEEVVDISVDKATTAFSQLLAQTLQA